MSSALNSRDSPETVSHPPQVNQLAQVGVSPSPSLGKHETHRAPCPMNRERFSFGSVYRLRASENLLSF